MRVFTVTVSFKDGVLDGNAEFGKVTTSGLIAGVQDVTTRVRFDGDGVKALVGITAAAQFESAEQTTFGAIIENTINCAIAKYNNRGPRAVQINSSGTATEIGFLTGEEAANPLQMLAAAGFTSADVMLSMDRK